MYGGEGLDEPVATWVETSLNTVGEIDVHFVRWEWRKAIPAGGVGVGKGYWVQLVGN